ncbi:hypothetical protein FQR65_LT14729 [Abscondita terminalis]|nr:hypothetical protein FQR65_LT14729 [Abscondita terminalis]
MDSYRFGFLLLSKVNSETYGIYKSLWKMIRQKRYNAGKLVKGTTYDSLNNETLYTQQEIAPEYPGGIRSLMQKVANTFKYSREMMENNINGTVIISFVVKKDGFSPHPEQYDLVLNDQGKGFPVQYKGFQNTSTDGDNGRQTADNFDKSAGFLYQLKENKLTSSATAVILTDKAFLSSRKVLIPHAAKDAGTMPAAVQKLVAEKNRKVKNFKNIAQFDEKTIISIVEFEVKNDSALAVLVYSSPEKTINQEYKAKYDDMSTWRVDDGGNFNMDYIDILYAFVYKDNIELVLSDMGAEGYNVTYLKEKAGVFVVAKESYGYSAPF